MAELWETLLGYNFGNDKEQLTEGKCPQDFLLWETVSCQVG